MKKSIFILPAIYFLLTATALAEVTNPYIVDEKLQVLFGDSWEIGDYYGLENYVHDYVNGYLHITFTYTHHQCCTASYPPSLYVTSLDPTSTTTMTVRENYYIFPLHSQPTHLTGLYYYDIQFDSTGYTAIVTASSTEVTNFHKDIAGLTNTDWAALANHFPLHGSFDGSITPFSMSFAPLQITLVEAPPVPSRTPVIIVPGIMSTELLDENILGLNKIIWPDTIKLAASPLDDFLDVLKMDNNGLPISNKIVVRDVIRSLNDADYFDGLIINLIEKGYQENIDMFTFPYDWRIDIVSSKNNFKNKIDQIKTQTGTEKIDIISHSMGGLVLKTYLKEFGGNSISNFIDIGTPHQGSSNAFKILMYGDNLGVNRFFNLIGINSERIKIISQNMPSIYELLPSSLYGNYLYDLDDFDTNGVKGLLSYSETKEFMKNTGRNSFLVDRADAFHQEIDNLNPADYGVKTYNIVGCGTPTLGKIFILNKEDSGEVEYNISYTNGDGTVPLKSAEAIPAHRTYYLKNATHALMPSTSGVKELIASILVDEDIDISPYSNLATSATGCNIPNGKIVSFHSPIELHVYDSAGNHTGPNTNGDIENNIPEISYDIIDGNKFAFLPDGVNYTVKGEATDVGTFNARIETFTNERVTETKYFNAVPLTSTTQVEVKSDVIAIDNDADGVVDAQIQPSAVLNETQSGDITKPITRLDIKGNKVTENAYISSVQISLSATDDNAGVLKTEYSLDNGKTWAKYTKKFMINERGGVKLMYRSTDKAGNIESVKSTVVNIINPGNSGKKK